ncbi:tripartite tricarboxylate transporter TctB family protein [Saccharomonospora sp. NPDC046836]|uniref:tripartite tricarboxylate transporter TctB family protein n=1 Tax=Saccharomonospora sp. NPDC046836 TaxID=3156921 RepID=UPI0033EE928D
METQTMAHDTEDTNAEVASGKRWVVRRIPALILLIIALAFAREALVLPIGGLREPGPGFWILTVSILLAVLAVALGIKPVADIELLNTTSGELIRVAAGFAGVVGFLLLFYLTGYFLSTLVLTVYMARLIRREPWLRTLIIAVLSGAVVHGFFVVLLGLPSPG